MWSPAKSRSQLLDYQCKQGEGIVAKHPSNPKSRTALAPEHRTRRSGEIATRALCHRTHGGEGSSIITLSRAVTPAHKAHLRFTWKPCFLSFLLLPGARDSKKCSGELEGQTNGEGKGVSVLIPVITKSLHRLCHVEKRSTVVTPDNRVISIWELSRYDHI